MNKHTKGPWTLDKTFQIPVIGYDVKDGGGLLPIVDVVSGYNKHEAMANAQLIAAAPDLLEALELCYDHCRLYHPEVETNNVGEAVRKAVDKARGWGND